MIRAIQFQLDGQAGNLQLRNLERVNVLIGRNNSGKSRVLREVFKTKLTTMNVLNTFFMDLYAELQQQLSKQIGHENFYAASFFKINNNRSDSLVGNVLGREVNTAELVDQTNSLISHFKNSNVFNVEAISSSQERSHFHLNLHGMHINSSKGKYENVVNEIREVVEIEQYYIPSLRTYKNLADPSVLKDETVKVYFPKKAEISKKIITGQGTYSIVDELLRKNRISRDKLREFENFLSSHFFDGKPLTLIPEVGTDSILIEIGQEERPLTMFGDGLASVIIVLLQVFLLEKKSLILLDEPENHLHPDYQKKLIEAFFKNKNLSRHQYIIASHSNHIIDLALINQHSVRPIFVRYEESKVTLESSIQSFHEILDNIGAMPTSVHLANRLVWVEGPHDVVYFRKYIESYLKANPHMKDSVIEGINFAFLFYGGKNLMNLIRLDSIKTGRFSPKALFVLDGDMKTECPEWEKEIGDAGQISYHIPSKSVENLIPASIIEKYLDQYFKGKWKGTIEIDHSKYLQETLSALMQDEKCQKSIMTDYRKEQLKCYVMESEFEWGGISNETKQVVERIINFVTKDS